MIQLDSLTEELCFPFQSEKSQTYRENLKGIFTLYHKYVVLYSAKNKLLTQSLIDRIVKYCENLIECLDFYLKGRSSEAYNKLDNILQELSNLELTNLNKGEHLFRMRISEDDIESNNEMFHIPFSSRNLVRTQRYSIAGLPCLYLGSSHFICWYELNKPGFHDLYASSFQLSKNLSFLDLSNDLGKIDSLAKQNDLENFLLFYPIAIACNFKTRFPNAQFNEEYIIPNLLLEWVLRNKTIDGIKYLSVKYSNHQFRDTLMNFVLPPQKFNSKSYCNKLASKFLISNPASFPILVYGPNPDDHIAFQTIEGTDPESALLNTYRTTVFGRSEEILKKLPHLKLNNLD